MIFNTYILYSFTKDRYYVGSTGNLSDRLERHNGGRSKATKSGIPWQLVYQKSFALRSEAYQFEMYIKRQKSRQYIEKLIINDNGNKPE